MVVGKLNFLKKLGLNNFFGEVIKTEWISGIDIDKKRRVKIQFYFSNETEVYVTDDNNVNNYFEENKKLDELIIMDDVSGVAAVSKKFANFLTVSRKFGYNCIYVFHVIVPASQI